MATPLPPEFQPLLDRPTAFERVLRIVVVRGAQRMDVSRWVTGGSIVYDGRRAMRWSGGIDLTLPAGHPAVPNAAGDLLTPYGSRAEVALGVRRVDGAEAVVPFGHLVVVNSRVDMSSGSRAVALGLGDPAEALERYRFEQPFYVPPGDLATLINSVTQNRLGVSAGLSALGRSHQGRTLGLETDTGPWSEMVSILQAFGLTMWYDRQGILQAGPQPDPLAGVPRPLDGPRALSQVFDSQPYNVAVARGESPDGAPPVSAVSMDVNPNSPTWAGTQPGQSPYGRSTVFIASGLMETSAQAKAAADALLDRHKGQGAAWEVSRPFDPTTDPDDLLRTSVPGETATVDLAVDSVTVNFTGETVFIGRQIA